MPGAARFGDRHRACVSSLVVELADRCARAQLRTGQRRQQDPAGRARSRGYAKLAGPRPGALRFGRHHRPDMAVVVGVVAGENAGARAGAGHAGDRRVACCRRVRRQPDLLRLVPDAARLRRREALEHPVRPVAADRHAGPSPAAAHGLGEPADARVGVGGELNSIALAQCPPDLVTTIACSTLALSL